MTTPSSDPIPQGLPDDLRYRGGVLIFIIGRLRLDHRAGRESQNLEDATVETDQILPDQSLNSR